jgi:hypothetical protein
MDSHSSAAGVEERRSISRQVKRAMELKRQNEGNAASCGLWSAFSTANATKVLGFDTFGLHMQICIISIIQGDTP